jgi:hypothetical protein
MEALACRCQVFSSVNGGLSDYLDPGFNCYKIAGYSKEYDIQRILKVLENSSSQTLPEQFFEEYRSENIARRLRIILDDINDFFDHNKQHSSTIKNITRMRMAKLLAQKVSSKLWQKYLSGNKR